MKSERLTKMKSVFCKLLSYGLLHQSYMLYVMVPLLIPVLKYQTALPVSSIIVSIVACVRDERLDKSFLIIMITKVGESWKDHTMSG